MNNYTIENSHQINDHSEMFILSLSDNIGNINRSIIPDSQLDRINKYRFAEDENRRLLSRSFLYELLKEKFDISNFNIVYNKYQKPSLESFPEIAFSFSYAREYVVIGISTAGKLGVDIEFIDTKLELDGMSRQIFSNDELNRFNSLETDNRATYFFRLFSAKESLIKAFGTGLYYDVKQLNTESGNQFIYQDTTFTYLDICNWKDQYTVAACYEELL